PPLMNYPAKKSLGQHFMTDPNMIRKIIAAIAPRTEEHILEIGPGRGALTRPLLESGCRLSAVEMDSALAAYWKEAEIGNPGFRCVEGNILRQDWRDFFPLDKVAGNIPYNISRDLMYKIFDYHAVLPEAFLLVQREFAEKLCAGAGEAAYGVLSVLTQILAEVRILFFVPQAVFSPPPRVDSAFLHIRFKKRETDLPVLKHCVQTAFFQRRKKLRNSLEEFYRSELETRFDWDSRADSLSPERYQELLKLLFPFTRETGNRAKQ
ncbi:MAG: 16S rRNA (adenine(1518)-N(6)/adenine(1519)-N(6))-dimethyltransferase RsmA, partial [Candidatus Neomarinimicrobiota bacterium]